jgi:uncharacterized protein (DUF58 family)
MKVPIRLDGSFPFLFLGIYLVMHLAASYLGGAFGYVSRFLSLLLFLDLVHLFWNYRRIRYSQNFSTTHPVKGQNVEYIFRLRMESPLPGARVLVTFKGIREDLRIGFGTRNMDFFPGANAFEEHRKQIQCPFRGTYTVGLDSMELQDALAMLWVKVPVWFITFYVYPRLIELESCRLTGEGKQVMATSLADGAIVDPTRFRALTVYRPGESVRHLAWKKFAATGIPFLREWELSAYPGITLYLDTWRRGEPDYQSLLAEDCALEILLALAHWFVRQEIPVYVRLDGGLTRLGGRLVGFQRFMADTARLSFCPRNDAGLPSLLADLESDIHDGLLGTVAVAGIFRGFDQEVISFLETYSDVYRHCYAIVVSSALASVEYEKAREYRTSSPFGDRLVLVRDSETIREDLS